MATIIPSSGSISASYMEKYIGGGSGNQRLSGIYSGSNFSLNQLFNSRYTNRTDPWSNSISMGSLRGKCFGVYTSSSRNLLHGSSYNDTMSGYFIGYFGFGTTTSGRSGVLNTINQGFPIGVRVSTLSGSNFGIRVRVYDGSSWTTLPFGTPAFEAIGNFSAITLDADVGYSYEIYLQVWPAKDSNTLANGNGVHSISLRLEEPNIGGSSEESSDPFGKDPGKGLPRR